MAYEEYIAVVGIFIILVVALLRVALKLGQEHSPLKLFLIWAVAFLIIPGVVVIQDIATELSLDTTISTLLDVVLYISIMVVIVMSAYFAIYVLKQFMLFATNSNKSVLRT